MTASCVDPAEEEDLNKGGSYQLIDQLIIV